MKVRITATPREREMDGVNLDRLLPGVVREVSPSLGAWLVAAGYAAPEMRNTARNDDQSGLSDESRGADERRTSAPPQDPNDES